MSAWCSSRLARCRSACWWGFLACYPAPKHAVTVGDRAISPEDRVGIDDTFDVRVYGETRPDRHVPGRHRRHGRLSRWPAGFRSPGSAPARSSSSWSTKLKDRYLKDPQVIVTIKDRNSQKISVLGQVTKPGQVGYYPNMTIVDAIASAGGFTGIAAKNSVNLRREVGGQDRDARLSGRRHQRRTLSQRDGSPR